MECIIRSEVTPQSSGTSRSPSRTVTDTLTAVAAKDTLDATIDDQDPLAKETGSCTVTVARESESERGSGAEAETMPMETSSGPVPTGLLSPKMDARCV